MSKVIDKFLSAEGRGRKRSEQDAQKDWLFRFINEKALEEDQEALNEDEEIKSELKSLQNDHANKVFVVEANNPTGQNSGNPGHFARIIGTQTGTATSATSKLQQRKRSNPSRTSFS
jgi:hypothetical protein